MITTNHIADWSRLVMRLVAWYMLPWAKFCDFVIFKVVDRRPAWLNHFWYISAGLMSLILIAHVIACVLAFELYVGGHNAVSPCVCEAVEQQTGNRFAIIRFRTGSILIDAANVLKACVVVGMTAVSLLAQIFEAVWSRPLVTFVALSCLWIWNLSA